MFFSSANKFFHFQWRVVDALCIAMGAIAFASVVRIIPLIKKLSESRSLNDLRLFETLNNMVQSIDGTSSGFVIILFSVYLST